MRPDSSAANNIGMKADKGSGMLSVWECGSEPETGHLIVMCRSNTPAARIDRILCACRSIAVADIEVPEIKALGTFECSAKLHPEVKATFSVVVQKEKNVTSAKKK